MDIYKCTVEELNIMFYRACVNYESTNDIQLVKNIIRHCEKLGNKINIHIYNIFNAKPIWLYYNSDELLPYYIYLMKHNYGYTCLKNRNKRSNKTDMITTIKKCNINKSNKYYKIYIYKNNYDYYNHMKEQIITHNELCYILMFIQDQYIYFV